MSKTQLYKKVSLLGIVLLFTTGCFIPALTGTSITKRIQTISPTQEIEESEENTIVTCVAFGKTHNYKQNIALTQDDATMIFEMLQELKFEMTQHPFSKKTQALKIAFIEMLDQKGLIQNDVSKETYLSLLNQTWLQRIQNMENKASVPQPFPYRGTSTICSVGSGGTGYIIPLFLLPRPRIIMLWSGNGLTTATNMRTGKGYVAGGDQKGSAFGFIGIGISYAVPGTMVYGFIGYALFASTTAEQVENYPPNRAPEISDIQPVDGQKNVPLSLTQLQFRIQDSDGDLMSYTVITNPDIGSANGNLKPFGVYTVPVSGLQDLTKYTWSVQVTDGKETTNEIFNFTTEAIAPEIADPSPADGERDVFMNLPQLQFTLKDYQGDSMEYTVQTSPNIGSAHVTGVDDGTYTVPISGMTNGATYRWYVNATDGAHWTRKIFSFETGYPSQFNPFDYGWRYRKQITVDHTQILDDLTDFPVLISISDNDLHQKAQVDGGDIMFMNGIGISTQIYHDLESYVASSGTLTSWVKVPFLSSSDNTVFYMYYGNPSCINQSYPNKTWDSNFEAVWHMNDATLMTIADSTSHSYTGTKIAPNEPQQAVGKIGAGQDFDGIDDYIQFTNPVIPIGPKTISAWINRHSTGLYEVVFASCTGISGHDAGTSWSFLTVNNTLQFVLGNGQGSGHYMTLFVPHGNINSWHYYTMTYDGTTLQAYIDGALAGSTTTKSGSEQNPTYNLRMGKTNHPSYKYNIDGGLDEIQVSNVVRSSAWIQTSYKMMIHPDQFLSFGPEVPGP